MKKEHVFIILLAINIAMMIGIYQIFITERTNSAGQEDRPHFAVICNTPDEGWERLCQGIDAAAEACGVSVEYMESVFSGIDADANAILMATEAKVDGIAIFSTDGNIAEAVAYAREKGIPVVTMVHDAPESRNDIFVGVEKQDYGQYLKDTLQALGNVQNVGLIYSNATNEEQMREIEAALSEEYTLQVISRSSSYIFDTSETVKELAMNNDGLQVICCVDENTTRGVAQAVVDWKMIHKLQIIGAGDSEDLLSLVEKEVVSAVIVTDYQSIGYKTIQGLSNIYTSSSRAFRDTDVALRTISQENIAAYMKEKEDEA